MTRFLLVPDDRQFDSAEAAAQAVRPPWDRMDLARALSKLQPGDELEVDGAQSFIALSGKTTEFKG